MTFKNIAILGATGNIGQHICRALLATPGLIITILTRAESNSPVLKEFEAAGGKIIRADVKDQNALIKAFEGIDVVVSSLGGAAFMDQLIVIKAAKEAGVKRFYPSEYGIDGLPNFIHPLFVMKNQVRQATRDAGLEMVIFGTGMFLEWFMSPFYTVDHENHTVEIVGDGNVPICGSTMAEIGQLVAQSINHDLVSGPSIASKGEKEWFVRAGCTVASWNQILDAHSKATGTVWKRKYVTIDEAIASYNAKDPMAGFGDYLRIILAQGAGDFKPNHAKEFRVEPKSFIDMFSGK